MLLSCAPPPPLPAPTEIWPTRGWPASTPEAQGVDSGALADAISVLKSRNLPIHSLLIERNGYLILDTYFFPYADNEPHDVASVTKSVTSTLVGIALNDNASMDVNERLASLLPEESISDPRKEQITLANLLSMTSGIDCNADQSGRSELALMETSPHWTTYMLSRPIAADPGSVFSYCAGNMQLVSAVLTRATGKSAFEFAQEKLFGPLGIADASWPADPDGVSHGFADLRLQPRDLAKLGYLWLHDGRWEGKQLVSPVYMKAALAPQASVEPGIQYGYGMWLYPGHTPYDFEANGRGGQRITVIPQLNAVVVVTGGGLDANEVTPLVAKAFVSNTPLSADRTNEVRLAAAIAQAASAPVASVTEPFASGTTEIFGQTYYLPPNPMGIRSLSINPLSAGQASLSFGFSDGTGEEHPIGLDGSPRLSPNLKSGLPVAVSGRWESSAFVLDYDEIARINAYRLVLTPISGGLSVHLTERSGLANMTLTATGRPPDQLIAGVTGGHG